MLHYADNNMCETANVTLRRLTNRIRVKEENGTSHNTRKHFVVEMSSCRDENVEDVQCSQQTKHKHGHCDTSVYIEICIGRYVYHRDVCLIVASSQ